MVFGMLVLASLINPDAFLIYATQLNDLVLRLFSNGFTLAALLFVVTCIWAAFSPLGKVRIGGDKATPLLSRWNWMAISLTTTIAIGIVFWGTAEPLYHLYTPGGTNIEPGSREAQRFSIVSMYMHWSFTPYAIYTIPGLTFALVYYNLKKPFSLSSPLTVLTGRPIPKLASDLLDALALLALLLGLAASLGTGILSISGGITRLFNIPTSTFMLVGIALVIVAAFFISSATGLHKGIRILSDINTKIFLAIIVFIIVTGPILAIVKLGGESVIQYIQDFIPRSLTLSPFDDRDWLNSWTVFYFANWMAWAPLAGLFLGRIARGYTVREYILMNLVIPAMFSLIWMTIFGGLTLSIEASEANILNDILVKQGPEHVLYKVLDYLPLSLFMACVIILVSFISYVTAADSNIDVIANLCSADETSETTELKDTPGNLLGLKLIWAVVVGAAATIMTVLSGVDGIKMLSNLGGLPALFIILTFNLVLFLLGTIKLGKLRSA
jgi:choline-glycine betaine transporter